MEVGSFQNISKEGRQINLKEISADEREHKGTVWPLEGSEDLNANLVRFPSGDGVDEHVNDEVDVIFLGISGSGFVNVDGNDYRLSDGALVFVSKGLRRSTRSASDDFAYLTVHRRRGPLRLGTGQQTRERA